MAFIFFLIFSYLAGSIPFGKIIAQKRGIDIQKKGSGNIGFTNAFRTLGLKPAILVLVSDILKGFFPTFLALRFLSLDQTLMIGLTTILAHIFPVWLKFKGGKGIATSLGTLLAINPLIALIVAIVFLMIFLSSRIVSVSSILSSWSLPLISYFLSPNLTMFFLVLAIVITWAHRENIYRLMKGTEKPIATRQ